MGSPQISWRVWGEVPESKTPGKFSGGQLGAPLTARPHKRTFCDREPRLEQGRAGGGEDAPPPGTFPVRSPATPPPVPC